MRNVSRTHRVDLDWLSDRVSLHLGIQLTCVNSSQQIADTQTKGSFSREQSTHVFNLMTPQHHTCRHLSVSNFRPCKPAWRTYHRVPQPNRGLCTTFQNKDKEADSEYFNEADWATVSVNTVSPQALAASMEEQNLCKHCRRQPM